MSVEERTAAGSRDALHCRSWVNVAQRLDLVGECSHDMPCSNTTLTDVSALAAAAFVQANVLPQVKIL